MLVLKGIRPRTSPKSTTYKNPVILYSVEAFILEKEGHQQAVLQFLNDLMMSTPEVTSKIRYKVPFYYRKSWICYLNPIKKPLGIELAFLRGNELSNEQGLLDFKGRKQVAGVTFETVADIPVETLLEVIQEAIWLDETTPYASKRASKK